MATNLSIQSRMFTVPQEEQLTTSASIEDDVCAPLAQQYLLMVSGVPCFVAIENMIFLFLVLLHRKTLRHNNVYTYVTSALVANVLTSLWAFYHFINYYFGIESAKPTFWWAFRKGMTVGFSLILCGNIGLLIYAIEDNIHKVGKLVSRKISSMKTNNKLNRKVRWRNALLRITFVWITPVAYGLLAMTPWNCTNECTCTQHLSSGAPLCKGERCSRIYTPMSKTYLLVIVFIWLLECSLLLCIICKAAISFPSLTGQSNRTDLSYEESTPGTSHGYNNSQRKVSHLRRLQPKMARSYRFPFILLGLFFLCSAPVMVVLVLDIVIKDFNPGTLAVNLVTPFPLLYCFISPFILTRRLAGMKTAVTMTLSFNWLKGGWNNVSMRSSNRSTEGNPPLRSSVALMTQNSEDRANGNMPPSTV